MSHEQDKKYNKFKDLFADKLAKAYPSLGKNPAEIYDGIVSLDPTSLARTDKQRYLYLEWICSRILKNPPEPHNLYKIRDDLKIYISMTRLDKTRAKRAGTIYYKPYVNAEINQYETLSSLSEAMFAFIDLKERKKSLDTQNEERQKAEKESIILYDGPEGRIICPLTTESSQYWGRGTKWCISAEKSDNLFQKYYDDGNFPVIMFLPKGINDKYAFNEYDKASGRTAKDEKLSDKDSQTLGKFFSKVAVLSEFDWQKVQENQNLQRCFQLFFLLNPTIFSMLQKEANRLSQELPSFITTQGMIQFCEDYSLTSEFDDIQAKHEELCHVVIKLLLGSPDIFCSLISNNFSGHEHLKKMLSNSGLSREDLSQVIDDIFLKPSDAQTASEWKADFEARLFILGNLDDIFPDVENIQDAENYKSQIAYLKMIPKELFLDREFAFYIFSENLQVVDSLIDNIPEIFDHPEVWLKAFEFLDIHQEAKVITAASAQRFAHIPIQTVDGKAFLEILVNQNHDSGGKVLDDVFSAACIYEAFEMHDGVDWTPLTKRLEQIYPNGIPDSFEVQVATDVMKQCDLSTLLERTLKRHPEFFEDIAVEHHTPALIKLALKHDPECLADVAAPFFRGDAIFPEMREAFQRMVAMNSPYLGMVSHHFEEQRPR
jgi:hypothetical protein